MSNEKKFSLLMMGTGSLCSVGYVLHNMFNNDFLGMFVGFLAFVIFYILLHATWEEME